MPTVRGKRGFFSPRYEPDRKGWQGTEWQEFVWRPPLPRSSLKQRPRTLLLRQEPYSQGNRQRKGFDVPTLQMFPIRGILRLYKSTCHRKKNIAEI